MKKIMLSVLAVFFYLFSFSQHTYYAAAKAGLSLRERPGTNSKVIDKVPYGEKLVTIDIDSFPPSPINSEGFNGYWWKVTYNNKTGYVVSSYVLPYPAPKTGIKSLKDYFTQVSSINGGPLVIKKTDPSLNEMGESTLTKQMFKNGMEWHQGQGYESGNSVYIIPDLTLEQSFLLLRLVGEFSTLISEKDPFPSKNSTTKIEGGEKAIEVEREKVDGKPGPVKRVKIILTQGAYTELEIFLLEGQAVIFWSSGV